MIGVGLAFTAGAPGCVGRARKKAETGNCEGRKSMLERNPYIVQAAKRAAEEKPRSLREIAEVLAAQGFPSRTGEPFAAKVVRDMLTVSWPDVERSIVGYETRKAAA